jgi:threonine dehydratase
LDVTLQEMTMTVIAQLGPEQDLAISFRDVFEATKLISGKVLRTPTLPAPKLSQLTGAKVFVKYENLQITGSFKDRGALVKLLSLTEDERRRGVIAMSAGNHAQAVAFRARKLGIPATIVMPEQTPFVKVGNTEAFGAEVILAGETVAEAREHALVLGEERGLVFVHPYDDARVMAGQGTVGAELLEDQPDLDCAVFPIGGGGLIAGSAVAMKKMKPDFEVIGVESALFASAIAAVAGEKAVCGGQTLAEGIAVKSVGSLTLPVIKHFVSHIVSANENQIERAVAAFMSLQKTMAEGAGAAGLAALLADPERFRGRKVGLVLGGGNIDPLVLAEIIQRGMVRAGRLARVLVEVRDLPGSLAQVTACLAEQNANIEEVHHQRAFTSLAVQNAQLELVLKTRNHEHVAQIVAALQRAGFKARAHPV